MSWQAPVDSILSALRERAGRPRIVFSAILRILAENLPAVADELNWPSDVRPQAYVYAGEDPQDPHPRAWPRIVIAGSSESRQQGMWWEEVVRVGIVYAVPHPLTRYDMDWAADVAVAARAILLTDQFRGRFYDPDNPQRLLWRAIQPAAMQRVPPQWTAYDGWVAFLDVYQPPNSNYWE